MTPIDGPPVKAESHAALVLIIHDASAQRVLLAWTFYPHKPLPKVRLKESQEAAEDRLWKAREPVNFAELSKLADVPATRCETIFYRLRMSRLIHPDGAISKIAEGLVDGQIQAHVRGLIRKVKTNGRT